MLHERRLKPFQNQETTTGLVIGPDIENADDVGMVETL